MARGGKRKGAGRPKGSPNKTTQEIREYVLAHLDEVLQGIIDLATGGAKSENVQFASAKELLHTVMGRPRLAEEVPSAPVKLERVYRWAMDGDEAMFDPARAREEEDPEGPNKDGNGGK